MPEPYQRVSIFWKDGEIDQMDFKSATSAAAFAKNKLRDPKAKTVIVQTVVREK